MKIIFVINSTYPNYTGGRETWLNNISNILCENNDIYILCEENYKGNNNGELKNVNKKIKMFKVKTLFNYAIFRPFLKSYIKLLNLEYSKNRMKKTIKKIIKNKQDKYYVVSMDTVFTGRVGTFAKKRFKNVIYINSVRGPHAEIYGERYHLFKNYFRHVELKTLKEADKVWSNGYDTYHVLEKMNIKSTVIKNGVDIKRANTDIKLPKQYIVPNSKFNILSIGTLLDIKGYIELIEAISLLKHKYNLIVGLTIFGKGDPQKYSDYAYKLGVKKQIIFAGYISKTVEYAKHFDLITCLSGGGGMSMACIESMLSGTPVIAWDTEVYKQLINDNINGYLTAEKDSEKLASKIYYIYNNKNEAKQIGILGHNSALLYDWVQIANDIVENLK